MGFVSVLDFFGEFVFLEHGRDGQTGIKNILDHFRNTHARSYASATGRPEFVVRWMEQFKKYCEKVKRFKHF